MTVHKIELKKVLGPSFTDSKITTHLINPRNIILQIPEKQSVCTGGSAGGPVERFVHEPGHGSHLFRALPVHLLPDNHYRTLRGDSG